MTFDQIILWVMAAGVIIGAADKIFGNRLGLGEKFDEGFNAMGPLALGMVGIVCLAPVIADLLGPAIIPLFEALGADPAMFGAILANDMGGYPLAMELAKNQEAGLLAGNIVASMLGCTLVFSIPVGLGLIEKGDRPYFSKGLLIGLVTIPAGSLIGGLIAGFGPGMVLRNTVPVIILAVLLALGLKFIPEAMVKGCMIFGQFITIVIYIGLAAAAFEHLTGVVIIPGMADIMEGMNAIAGIGIVLLGTFPVLTILTKILDKPLNAVGRKIGLDKTSVAGLVHPCQFRSCLYHDEGHEQKGNHCEHSMAGSRYGSSGRSSRIYGRRPSGNDHSCCHRKAGSRCACCSTRPVYLQEYEGA